MSFIRSLIDDFKALRRGEVRIAPRGTRGHVYRKIKPQGEQSPPNAIAARSKHTVTVTPRRVYSAAEDLWYSFDEWQKRFPASGG